MLRRLVHEPVQVITSPRLSAADVACGLEIRQLLLERTTCPDPLAAITYGTKSSGNGIRIVIGGPLVRTTLEPYVSAECDLTDARGYGWEIMAGGERAVHCDDDETVGCWVVGSDARTLFVFGVRDAGTVIATRWLAQALDNCQAAGTATWIALRRSRKEGALEEVARGS